MGTVGGIVQDFRVRSRGTGVWRLYNCSGEVGLIDIEYVIHYTDFGTYLSVVASLASPSQWGPDCQQRARRVRGRRPVLPLSSWSIVGVSPIDLARCAVIHLCRPSNPVLSTQLINERVEGLERCAWVRHRNEVFRIGWARDPANDGPIVPSEQVPNC